MKALLAKQDALGINSYAAGLFNFFADAKDAETLETYAKSSLPPSATKAVAKTVDEIGFRAEFKQRFVPQLKSWIETRRPKRRLKTELSSEVEGSRGKGSRALRLTKRKSQHRFFFRAEWNPAEPSALRPRLLLSNSAPASTPGSRG